MSTQSYRGTHGRARGGTRTRTVAIAGAVAVALMAGSVAFATWIVSGDGSAPVSSASIKPLSVQVDSVSDLYPGASTDAVVRLSNGNPFTVVVDSLLVTPSSTCFTATADPIPPGTTVDSSSSAGTATPRALHVAVAMPLDAPASCAGQTFTLSVHVDASVGS